jgi:hypothetical protein
MTTRVMPGAQRLGPFLDGVQKRAVNRDQNSRRRVCTSCILESDHVLGRIQSEFPCDRCSRVPCIGAIVEVAG